MEKNVFCNYFVLDRRYRQDRTGEEDESEIYSISSRGVSCRGKGLFVRKVSILSSTFARMIVCSMVTLAKC